MPKSVFQFTFCRSSDPSTHYVVKTSTRAYPTISSGLGRTSRCAALVVRASLILFLMQVLVLSEIQGLVLFWAFKPDENDQTKISRRRETFAPFTFLVMKRLVYMDVQGGGEQGEESPGEIKFQLKLLELNTVNLNNYRLIPIHFRMESSVVK